VVQLIGQSNPIQEVAGALSGLAGADFTQEFEGDQNVLQRAECGQEVERLEHEPYVSSTKLCSSVFGKGREVLPVEEHSTVAGVVETGKKTQQGRLPAPRRAQDSHHGPRLNAESHVLKHGQGTSPAPIRLTERFRLDHLSSVRVRRWAGPTTGLLLISLANLTGCGEGNQPPGTAATAETAASAETPVTRSGAEGSRPRVVFLGTSLTAGYGLDDPERASWPGRIQFLADSAGIPIRVVNAGVSGETTAGGLRRLEWVLQEPLSALVVELGANDGLRGLQIDDMEANLSRILQSTAARYPEARLFLLQMEAPTNMGRLFTGQFRKVFADVAEDHDATLIPFVLEGIAGVPALNQRDGIHPLPEGHDLMARAAWETLEPALREIAERR